MVVENYKTKSYTDNRGSNLCIDINSINLNNLLIRFVSTMCEVSDLGRYKGLEVNLTNLHQVDLSLTCLLD